MKKVLIIAAEASSDLHTAKLLSNLVKELKKEKKEAVFSGIGGECLKKTGNFILEYDNANFSVLGITEILSKYTYIKKIYSNIKKSAKLGAYDLAILVDFPGANLPLAKYLNKINIPVIYYIPPKVWASRAYRIHKLKKYTVRTIGIFPNEPEFYKKYNADIDYVGNPLVELVHEFKKSRSKNNFFDKKIETKNIAVLLGSRKSEILQLSSVIKESIDDLLAKHKDINFYIPVASTLKLEFVKETLGIDEKQNLYKERVFYLDGKDASYNVLNISNFGIIASGTASLEAALFDVPSVIVYKISKLSYFLLRLFYKGFLGLPNILSNKEIFKELIQNDFTKNNIIKHLEIDFFNFENYKKTKSNIKKLKSILKTESSPSKLAASIIAKYL